MLLFFLFSFILFFSWLLLKRRTINVDIKHNVLLVTAHPDDELMFFGPTLLNEIRSRIETFNINDLHQLKYSKVHLLCLSNGDYYGIGTIRQQEFNNACNQLLKSCAASALDSDFFEEIFTWKILNDLKLIDSPLIDWPVEHILTILQEYIQQHKISKVITFDKYGISGHRNHSIIYETIRKLESSKGEENKYQKPEIWLLESVSLFRKYLALFDILFTGISAWWHNNWNILLISSLNDYLNLVHSLRKHRSQMVWFRYLYLYTSRYMFINTLKMLK